MSGFESRETSKFSGPDEISSSVPLHEPPAPVIVIAEDDPDDRLLAEEAFASARLAAELRFVGNGEELLNYLRRRGPFDSHNAPRPRLILLDLNMPVMDGREALQEIKNDAGLRSIPVVVLTTSRAGEDIAFVYGRGASAYLQKPHTFDGLVSLMQTLCEFWLGCAVLPEAAALEPNTAAG